MIPSEKGEFVASIPVALKLDSRILAKWKEKFPPARYAQGNVLFYRGHYPYGVFVFFSGKIDLKLSEESDHTMIEVRPGSALGLGSAIVDRPYPLTAIAATNVMASFVSKQTLKGWIRKKEGFFPKEVRLVLKPERKRGTRKAA